MNASSPRRPAHDLPVVSCDADWLDLRDGERAVLRGRLSGGVRSGATGAVVSTPCWELIPFAIPGGHAGPTLPDGTRVEAVVERVEDGLSAAVDAIRPDPLP